MDFKILCIDEDLNSITPEQWRQLTVKQRSEFKHYKAMEGSVSFCCITCGYPTCRGVAACDACYEWKSERRE